MRLVLHTPHYICRPFVVSNLIAFFFSENFRFTDRTKERKRDVGTTKLRRQDLKFRVGS